MITVKLSPICAPCKSMRLVARGTTFTGSIGRHTGLFLKVTDDIFILLNDPEHYWTSASCLSIDNYKAVDIVIEVT